MFPEHLLSYCPFAFYCFYCIGFIEKSLSQKLKDQKNLIK